jgi:predicted CXXCH cytochrome family protein
VARTRTTKRLAQRIDLNYFKRPTPYKRAKLWLCVVAPLLALTWIASRSFFHDSRVYSSGRMSEPHAVLEKQCASCHVQKAGESSSTASDSACLACHDAPPHHPFAVAAPDCATCHSEHRGRISLIATSNQFCALCHKDLRNHPLYASGINSLQDGHPEFAPFRKNGPNYGRDLGGIKLNHAIHMKPIRRGPNGPNVQLECTSCHHTSAAPPDLTYSDSSYRSAKVSYKESDELRLIPLGALQPARPASGRELMVPVRFADACAGCHSLQFDKRFDFGVPHDEPKVVREFVQRKFQEYIAAHPAELRVARDPDRDLTGKAIPPQFRTLTPNQWVEEQTAKAEELLWRKTCSQCHTVGYEFVDDHRTPEEIARWLRSALESSTEPKLLPVVGFAFTTAKWFPHAKFDHDAHRGFSCVGCHEKALTSTETSDVLIPGIENCRTCHAPGPEHAESRCFECHTYHDWAKRKEVKPAYTLPALRSGGR